jgi:fumarate hydratase class II
VHPNDHVNRSQSSNDVIPTTLHLSTYLAIAEELLPALEHLMVTIQTRAEENAGTVKTGRTHLMDATPLTVGQEMSAWASQVAFARARLEGQLSELAMLAIGGTAVGTGLNAPTGFGKAVAARLSALTGFQFREAPDHFAAQSCSDAAVATAGVLKTAAVTLMKLANDLRWLSSGPQAGLGELELPALQPGSSIMPGKVNPVVPEAVTMACASVMGNDVTATVAGQAANFQLSVMLPVLAQSLLESTTLLTTSANSLADKVVAGLTVREDRIRHLVERNTMLVTALNPVIGYDRAAEIAKTAYAQGRPMKEVAKELSGLSDDELDQLLDPKNLV